MIVKIFRRCDLGQGSTAAQAGRGQDHEIHLHFFGSSDLLILYLREQLSSRLDDGDLKQTVIFAFGAEDEDPFQQSRALSFERKKPAPWSSVLSARSRLRTPQ